MNLIPPVLSAEERARSTDGISSLVSYHTAARILRERGALGGALLDVGCGRGGLWEELRGDFATYIGVDLIHYSNCPTDAEFHAADLNQVPIPLPDARAEAVVSLGTIQCLENPRAFLRELARLVKPGGLVVVSTSNQLSLLSKVMVLLRNRFPYFQDSPLTASNISPLLESDLARCARDAGLIDVQITYTNQGRVPFTGRQWPRRLGFRGRAFSDEVFVSGTRPVERGAAGDR